MDTVTHMLVGACCSQLPGEFSKASNLSKRGQLSIGSIAAVFPDIDYLLFYINSIDFLAYWHRAETHSLILAPLWAIIFTWMVVFMPNFKACKKEIFQISTLAILSHCLIDSFTAYGTQWFKPFSDRKFKS